MKLLLQPAALLFVFVHLLNELCSTLKLAFLAEMLEELQRDRSSVKIPVEIQQMSLDCSLAVREECRPYTNADHAGINGVVDLNLCEVDSVLWDHLPI